MDTSDSILTKRIKKGSTEAFEAIYQRYHRPLFYMAIKYLKDHELAEDALQDVFVKLWDRRDTLDDSRSIRAYLFTILKNQLLNTIRDRNKTIISVFELDENILPREKTTEEEVIYNDYYKILEDGQNLLPDRKREIFELKSLGYNNLEIANLLTISVCTVKTHYYHGLKFIRDYLRKHAEL